MTRLSAMDAGGANVVAFLDTIAHSELGQLEARADTDGGYRVIVGSTPQRPILFGSYADHPRIAVMTAWGRSSAAGRYQIMAVVEGLTALDTWDWASRAAGVKDFSPEAQDRVAIELVRHRGSLDDVVAGRFDDAVQKCSREWASFPSAGYGQHENDINTLRVYYLASGGRIA